MKVMQVDMRCRIKKPSVGKGLANPIILNREECLMGTQHGVRLSSGKWFVIEDLISLGTVIEDQTIASLHTKFLFATCADKQFTCVLEKYVIVCIGLTTNGWTTLRDDIGSLTDTDIITSIDLIVVRYAHDIYRMIVQLRTVTGHSFYRVVEFKSSFADANPIYFNIGKNTTVFSVDTRRELAQSHCGGVTTPLHLVKPKRNARKLYRRKRR